MATYEWIDFTREKYYPDLIEFFALILENRVPSGEKHDSIVLISRKAYCLFLLLKKKGVINVDGHKVYSDRYIMKSLDKSLFQGESVYLVDDTVSTGKHMIDVYNMIRKKTSVDKIYPYVFMEDVEFRKKEENIRMLTEHSISIQSALENEASEILKFCSKETLLFHQESIPYAVELPILSRGDENYITLSEQQFEQLKNMDDTWTYIQCDQEGYLQNNISNAVMIMQDSSFALCHPAFIYSFLVRLQITREKDIYKIVAMPFSILKSIKLDELFRFFIQIYDGTEYEDQLIDYVSSSEAGYEEDIYVALYRGIVFNFSRYIGGIFSASLNRIIGEGNEVRCSCINDPCNYEETYLSSTRRLFSNQYKQYLLNVIRFPELSEVRSKNVLGNYRSKFGELTANYETVFLYIIGLINDIRNGGEDIPILDVDSKQRIKFITIEELCADIYRLFPSKSKKEMDIIIASCICSMLEQSKLANEIYYEKSTGIVYRGFKYGENSGALLDLPSKIFYIAVREFYENAGDEQYAKNYRQFLLYLKYFMIHYRIYGSVVSKDEFEILSVFFEPTEYHKVQNILYGLKFIAEDEKTPYYIEKLKEFIKTADIYN